MSTHELGGGFKYYLFSPRKLGKISNLTNFFQMGWFNPLPVFPKTNHVILGELRSQG